MPHKLVIAIDGHSSCGKSTFAKAIAVRLGYAFIDTGAMYRAVTLWAIRENLMTKTHEIVKRLDEVKITFKYNPEILRSEIYLNAQNVDDQIRTMEVSDNVSRVAAIPEVRHKLVAIQQEMGSQGGVVLDGRDIGTVVFPKADLKIFMTASVAVRAKRRYDEMVGKGDPVSLDEVEKNVAQRDHDDENRAQSPLKRAEDALILDNSEMTVEEQMTWFEELYKACITKQ